MDDDIEIRIGHDEVLLRNRYEIVSIVNDLMIAVWFVAGSILFFQESTTIAGTWCFLAGSIQLMLRPVIRLSRRVSLRKVQGRRRPPESSQDF